jgi:hypothetical protein
MSQQVHFKNVEKLIDATTNNFHPDKARFLIGLSVMKIGQDLNGGKLDLTQHENLIVYTSLIKFAAQHVGCSLDEVTDQLTNTVEALKRDFETFKQIEQMEAIDKVEDVSGASSYLGQLAARIRN